MPNGKRKHDESSLACGVPTFGGAPILTSFLSNAMHISQYTFTNWQCNADQSYSCTVTPAQTPRLLSHRNSVDTAGVAPNNTNPFDGEFKFTLEQQPGSPNNQWHATLTSPTEETTPLGSLSAERPASPTKEIDLDDNVKQVLDILFQISNKTEAQLSDTQCTNLMRIITQNNDAQSDSISASIMRLISSFLSSNSISICINEIGTLIFTEIINAMSPMQSAGPPAPDSDTPPAQRRYTVVPIQSHLVLTASTPGTSLQNSRPN